MYLVPRGLADTKQTGKLSREQFSLAMWLIQQKVTKGLDPPQTLTTEMIPPSERTTTSVPVSHSLTPSSSPSPPPRTLSPEVIPPLPLSPTLYRSPLHFLVFPLSAPSPISPVPPICSFTVLHFKLSQSNLLPNVCFRQLCLSCS